MAQEEDTLALLEQGRQEGIVTEVARQARYKHEDEQTAATRERETRLYEQGLADQATAVARVQAAIEARDNTPQKQANEKISDLQTQVADLRAMVEARGTPPAAAESLQVHAPDEPKPVV